MIVRITALCVAAAMLCSALRLQRPEMATVLSLAAGLAALALVWGELGDLVPLARDFDRLGGMGEGLAPVVLKGAGIAVVSELGAQLCADAGESALAGRVALASRIAMLGMCAPLLKELAGLVGEALP